MNVEYKDFIATYTDVYPEGYCSHLISEFEGLIDSGAGSNRQRGEGATKHHKDDLYLQLNLNGQAVGLFDGAPVISIFFEGLQRCYNAYIEQFSVLREGEILGSTMKMQRTSPGGGYHVWHAEQGNGTASNRVLVYMLYLNSLDENGAGETEFLYQKRRVKPQENVMVFWPAAFTHVHRGNTVFSEQSKYIVTGWFHYN